MYIQSISLRYSRHTPYGKTAGLSRALSKIGWLGSNPGGERVREASLSHRRLLQRSCSFRFFPPPRIKLGSQDQALIHLL